MQKQTCKECKGTFYSAALFDYCSPRCAKRYAAKIRKNKQAETEELRRKANAGELK
ncbi:hypothetical protein MUP95_10470 [bacterium]|nr:hypothetical protein [bacterium]